MESNAPAAAVAPKDRSTWLTVFGVLTILMGGACALFIPLMIFGATAASHNSKAAADLRMLVPGMAVYGILAIALVWLGIGSILARRWARAIILIFAWGWLAMGVITFITLAISTPTLLHQAAQQAKGAPGAIEYVVIAIIAGIFLFIFLLLPATWVWFYGRKSVRWTCETRNPSPSWTDACPLPVLGMSLLLGCTAPVMLFMPFLYRSVLPLFGTFLTGPVATFTFILLALIWGYGAYGSYRLDRRAWWLLVIVTTLFVISNALTYWFHDPAEMYRLMGYPEEQLATLQKNPLLQGHRMAWMTIVTSLPIVAYLLFVGRYFKAGAVPRHAGQM
jgi:hypothetical protein